MSLLGLVHYHHYYRAIDSDGPVGHSVSQSVGTAEAKVALA